MIKSKNYVCSKTACDENFNLYKLDLLWKERMTLPLWNLLPEDVFLKICKHVDSSFEAPNFDHLKYENIDNISYKVQKFVDDKDNDTPMTYEDLLALRSISLTTNADTLTPTEIIKPLKENLYTKYEQCRNHQEERKNDFLPKPENGMQYELMRKITYEDKYLFEIFG